MKKNKLIGQIFAIAIIMTLLVAGLLLGGSGATASGPDFNQQSDMTKGTPPPRYWAVIAGVSNYLYIGDLNYCDDDAQDIYNRLIGKGWQATNIRLLKDSQATKATIQSDINWIAANASSQDICLFFFSGHGGYWYDLLPYDEADGYDEYICPADSLTSSWANDIRDDELDAWMSPISAKKVVILDTCNSGGFVKSAKGLEKTELDIPPTALVDGFVKDINKTGFVVLMACNDTESSWDVGALQNGLFTYYLDQALSGSADVNGNGVSAEEAFAYAAPLTQYYSQAFLGKVQNPQLWDGISGEVILTPNTLNVSSTTGGSVTEPGEGVFTYNPGTVVDLLAVADLGYEFVNWSGDVGMVANINAADTTITLNGDYTITAHFTETQPSVAFSSATYSVA